MGERKVIQKYIPADFDPSLVPKGKKLSTKDGTVPVRMMLPFTLQCNSCNTFLYRGRKFNSKKEAMGGPDGKYLGITRWRFYIKCTQCSQTLTFLTDPKNADYEMENGGTRNYEVYKDKAKQQEEDAIEKEEQEKEDKMKALENRVLDSQREMADMDNLEEIKAMNRRHQFLDNDADAVLKAREEKRKPETQQLELNEHGVTEEEENLVKSIKFGASSNGSIRRLNEEDERLLEEKRQQELKDIEERQKELQRKTAEAKNASRPKIILKRKKPVNSSEDRTSQKQPKPNESTKSNPSSGGTGLAGLLGDYGSDSSDSD
jgi:hypothetical protein